MTASGPAARVLLACAGAVLLAACAGREERAAGAAVSISELAPGAEPVSAALGPGESHRYGLRLERGAFVRLAVEQHGIDVAVALAAPDGETLVEVNRPVSSRGAELVLAVAERPGEHSLVVHGDEAASGRYTVRIDALRPATAGDRRAAAALRRHAAAAGLSAEEQVERLTEALAAWRELDEPALEADAARGLGDQAFLRKQRDEAAEHYRAAAEAYSRSGERWPAARARLGSADMLAELTRTEEAVAEYRVALDLSEGLGDPALEARVHYGIGRAQQNQGELQAALDHYEEALDRFPEDHPLRPYALHNLGVLHAHYLADEPAGRRLLLDALDAWPSDPRYSRLRAFTLNQLGKLAYRRGDPDDARRRFKAALELWPESDACQSAVTLARLALVEQAQGRTGPAERRDVEARAALAAPEQEAGAGGAVAAAACPVQEATVHLLGGELAERRGDGEAARARYRRSLELFADWGDRIGQARSLSGIARAERALGRPEPALAASGRALEILEGVRPTVLREDLRTAFFAGAQDVFDLHIGLLIDRGLDAEAWLAAERARAQALRDLLAEAGAGVRASADPALAARERSLQRLLNELDARLAGGRDADALRALGSRVEETVAELERVRGEIRRRDPGGAASPGPGEITLDGLLGALEPETLLLEYRLGAAGSTLWAVTGGEVEAFELPPRERIESVAREAVEALRSLRYRPGRNPPAACALGAMLLGPVAGRTAGRSLIVVADGVLETVPFAALPDLAAGVAECAGAPLLVESHPIAHLPSVAALATQRRRLAGRGTADGWLAVVADPVYEAADERLAGARGGHARAGATAAGTGAARGRPANVPMRFRRLTHTGAEAAAILAGLPDGRTFEATGPAATREALAGGAVEGYRVLHVAAHGVLNAEQPLLSFLALSQFDPRGRPVEGALYAHEVYGLDLAAELVVLSACDTALGPAIRGEALAAGLPRAFLYAGAERVLVSLWQVPDDSTRELMTGFYRGLFERGLAPARALQEAQLELIRAGRRPHQWAGFVLQGDPRPLPPFSR